MAGPMRARGPVAAGALFGLKAGALLGGVSGFSIVTACFVLAPTHGEPDSIPAWVAWQLFGFTFIGLLLGMPIGLFLGTIGGLLQKRASASRVRRATPRSDAVQEPLEQQTK